MSCVTVRDPAITPRREPLYCFDDTKHLHNYSVCSERSRIEAPACYLIDLPNFTFGFESALLILGISVLLPASLLASLDHTLHDAKHVT